MQTTVGVLAPLVDDQFHHDYVLRLKHSTRELTLKNLRTLLLSDFDTSKVRGNPRWIRHTMAASGYYLEGLLRAQGFEPVLVNGNEPDGLQALAAKTPIAVCISTSMLATRASLQQVVQGVREAMPGVFVIVGGPLVWKSYHWYRETKREQSSSEAQDDSWRIFPLDRRQIEADAFVVAPHGAATLLSVLQQLQRGSKADLSKIQNLSLPDPDGAFSMPDETAEAVDFDEDFTRWDLVQTPPLIAPVRTSIGCPHHCEFCDFCRFYPKLTLRSSESLRRELEMISKHRQGGRPYAFYLVDDNVFLSRQRLREVCEVFSQAGDGLPWLSFTRGSRYVGEEAERLRDAAFTFALMGVESGDQGQLDRMNKRQKVDEIKTCIEMLDAVGIHTLMTMLVGFPGESAETLANTIAFLNGLRTSHTNYQLYPLHVLPMTGLSSAARRQQWKLTGLIDRWSHFSMNRAQADHACYEIFKQVDRQPYLHNEESGLYNERWTVVQRQRLFQLRHQLTIQLIEQEPWEAIEQTFVSIANEMEISKPVKPPPTLVDQLLIPSSVRSSA